MAPLNNPSSQQLGARRPLVAASRNTLHPDNLWSLVEAVWWGKGVLLPILALAEGPSFIPERLTSVLRLPKWEAHKWLADTSRGSGGTSQAVGS